MPDHAPAASISGILPRYLNDDETAALQRAESELILFFREIGEPVCICHASGSQSSRVISFRRWPTGDDINGEMDLDGRIVVSIPADKFLGWPGASLIGALRRIVRDNKSRVSN